MTNSAWNQSKINYKEKLRKNERRRRRINEKRSPLKYFFIKFTEKKSQEFSESEVTTETDEAENSFD